MSINSFGHLFRLTTWGESHGTAIGCVVDGCPPGLELDEAWVQQWLDRRKPGTSKNVSPRQEPDRVRILSGVYEGCTTGTPIAMMIDNVDAHSADYPKDAPYRPGHAGDSLGAVIECVATGVPAGWGAPVYAKLDAELAAACMGINAAKGVEIGDGFGAARLKGSQNADAMRLGGQFDSNHAGGIAGGISTGQAIVVRVAFKPTSSIRIPVQSVDATGREVEAVTKGRHDPCVGMRGAPVVEAMVALILADHKLLHRGQCG